jgi:hypothetical protein
MVSGGEVDCVHRSQRWRVSVGRELDDLSGKGGQVDAFERRAGAVLDVLVAAAHCQPCSASCSSTPTAPSTGRPTQWPSHPSLAQRSGGYIETRFAASNRDVGKALQPLLDLARGHPRAAMILAHALWEKLPENHAADAATWERALTRLPDYVTEEEMRARWDTLTQTQQKVTEVRGPGPREPDGGGQPEE